MKLTNPHQRTGKRKICIIQFFGLMDKDMLVGQLVLNVTEFGVPLRTALEQAWTGGFDYARKTLSSRHKRKIEQFTLNGIKIGEFDSIREAAKVVGYGKRYRGGDLIIGNVLAERTKHTKEGHIWKYKKATPDDSLPLSKPVLGRTPKKRI
jgi:hypothetical protein